jgi:hypothetical protein
MAFKLKVIFFWWRVGLIYWFMRVLEGNFGAFFSIWIWNDSFIINQTGRNIPKPLKHYNFKLVCWLTSVWLKRPLSQITNNETLIRFLCRQFRGFIVFFFRAIKYLVTSNMSIFYCGPSRVLVFSIISFHSELSLNCLWVYSKKCWKNTFPANSNRGQKNYLMWDNFWAMSQLPNFCGSGIQWYRFQNSPMVRDICLKFYMGVVLEKMEDHMHCFLPGHSTNNVTSINFFIQRKWN